MGLEDLFINESGILYQRLDTDHRRVYQTLVGRLTGEVLPFMPMNARYFTDHGVGHSQGIIEAIEDLLKDYTEQITPVETFVLLCSAWLHDLGMLVNVDENGLELSEQESREGHAIRSAKWIEKYHIQWGLTDETEADAIAQVCMFHSRGTDKIIGTIEEKLDEEFHLQGGQSIRLQFLAGLLRLGDALDCRWRRAPEALPEYFVRLPLESRLHWRLYGLILDVKPDTSKGEIYLYARYRAEREKVLLLWKVRDIYEELKTVNEILARNGIRLDQVSYSLEHKEELLYQKGPFGDAANISKEFTFPNALRAELEWNREQVLHLHPDSASVQTQCPPYVVAADISFLAANECITIERPGKWNSTATSEDKSLAARYFREAADTLREMAHQDRSKYFWLFGISHGTAIYGGAPIRQTCDSLQGQGRDAETKLWFGEYHNNVALSF